MAGLTTTTDPNMDLIKMKGCGGWALMVSNGGDDRSSVAMINRSQCYYLHRALETWLEPPDFSKRRIGYIGRSRNRIRYMGCFSPRAIDEKRITITRLRSGNSISRKCAAREQNFGVSIRAKPTLESAEYRKYLEYITERAMDLGIQVFLFGQVFIRMPRI